MVMSKMKTIRLLLFSSVFIAIAVIGWSVYYYYTTKQRTMRQVNVSLEDYQQGMAHSRNLVGDGDSQAITDEFLENSDEDAGVLFSIRTPSDDNVVSTEPEEYCCPEDDSEFISTALPDEKETYSQALSPSEKMRARLVKIHGDIPEVDTFMDLDRRLVKSANLTIEESLEHFRLMAFFHPSEQNVHAYEYMKKLYAEADPGSFRIEHGD